MLLLFQLNPSVSSFQRRFVSEIKRCEEMERILGKQAEHLGCVKLPGQFIIKVLRSSWLTVIYKKVPQRFRFHS